MAKSKKTEAAPEADVPVPTTPIETAPVVVAESAEPTRRKPRKAKADAAAVEPGPDGWTEIPPAPQVEPGPTPEPKRRKAEPAPTLADVFAGYLKSLDERGGSTVTIASYRMELEMAGAALGVDMPVADLTPERVLTFFTSDPVTRKRNGKAKSPLSIDKTRRVLRQALVWAGHDDLVPSMEAAS